MSRSRRKAIIKDCPRNFKKSSNYWRTVRRVLKEKVKLLQETDDEQKIPKPQEIVNDYDYSDYRFDLRFDKSNDYREKAERK